MRYSNVNIYLVLKKGESWPAELVERETGEGVIRGQTADGREWSKDYFRNPEELRVVVHGEDEGTLEIKTATEMRALLPVSLSTP
tara:strand:+ start:3864 stop:4118 length:255 start_codon:yes stop_codon:yes gene_type:complete